MSAPASTPIEPSPQSAKEKTQHPYDKFVLEQEDREVEWLANRGAHKAKKNSEVSILKQQLESRDRECALLREQLRGQESLCKVSTMVSNLISK